LYSIPRFKHITYLAIVHAYGVQVCKLPLVSPSGCTQHLNCFTKRICSRRSHSHNQVMFPYYKRPFVPALGKSGNHAHSRMSGIVRWPAGSVGIDVHLGSGAVAFKYMQKKKSFRGFPRSPHISASLVPRVKQRPLPTIAELLNSHPARLC